MGCLIALYDCRRDEGAVQILRLAGSTSNRPLFGRDRAAGAWCPAKDNHTAEQTRKIKIPTLVEVSTRNIKHWTMPVFYKLYDL